MVDKNTLFLGILIILAFAWRFARTRQLYLTSLDVLTSSSDPILFGPSDFRSFFDQALLGQRSISPVSFFIRAVVFLFGAICLLPFKHYAPILFWLVVLLIACYVPCCAAYGLLLRKHIVDIQSS